MNYHVLRKVTSSLDAKNPLLMRKEIVNAEVLPRFFDRIWLAFDSRNVKTPVKVAVVDHREPNLIPIVWVVHDERAIPPEQIAEQYTAAGWIVESGEPVQVTLESYPG